MQTTKLAVVGGIATAQRSSSARIAAMVLALGTSMACASAGAASLVMNGDFETVNADVGLANSGTMNQLATPGGPTWDVFATLPGGWTSTSGGGIELQTPRTNIITPHSGNHYVELDSYSPSSNSNMQQDIAFDAGEYQLSFWYSPRQNDIATNTINYAVGGSLLTGSISGPGGSPVTTVGEWTQITDTFTVGTAATLTLSFIAAGTEETLGGFIDTVSITAVPLPAAAWLFISALGGLLIGKRVKARA